MAYCLCVKAGDGNLLHIIQENHLSKTCYRAYRVVATAQNETEAFEAVADFVRAFCALYGIGRLTAPAFAAWIAGDGHE